MIVHSIQGEAMYAATLAEQNECALIISYSGETTFLLQAVKLLKQRNIPILLITSMGENSMTPLANCCLRISTREKLYSKIATYANDASITYLLDVLYSCLFQQDYDRNVALRKDSSKIFEKGRSSSLSLLKEQ